MGEELAFMVETYRQQGTDIMEMKALLMRYLMKSGTVDTTAQKAKRFSIKTVCRQRGTLDEGRRGGAIRASLFIYLLSHRYIKIPMHIDS